MMKANKNRPSTHSTSRTSSAVSKPGLSIAKTNAQSSSLSFLPNIASPTVSDPSVIQSPRRFKPIDLSLTASTSFSLFDLSNDNDTSTTSVDSHTRVSTAAKKTKAIYTSSSTSQPSTQMNKKSKSSSTTDASILFTAKDMVMKLPLSYLYNRPDLRSYAIERAGAIMWKLAQKKALRLISLSYAKWKVIPSYKIKILDRKVGVAVLLQALSLALLRVIRRRYDIWAIHYATRHQRIRTRICNKTAIRIQRWYRTLSSKFKGRKLRRILWLQRYIDKHIIKVIEIEKERLKQIRLYALKVKIAEERYIYYTIRKIQRQYRAYIHYKHLKLKWKYNIAIRRIIRWRNRLYVSSSLNFIFLHLLARYGGFTIVTYHLPNRYKRHIHSKCSVHDSAHDSSSIVSTTHGRHSTVYTHSKEGSRGGRGKRALPLVYIFDLCAIRIQHAWARRNQHLMDIYKYNMLLYHSACRIQYCYIAMKWRIFNKYVYIYNRVRRIQRAYRSYVYRLKSYIYTQKNRNKKALIIQRFYKARSLYTYINKKIYNKYILHTIKNIQHLTYIIYIQRSYRYYKQRVKETKVFYHTLCIQAISHVRTQHACALTIQRNYYMTRKPYNKYPTFFKRAVCYYYITYNRILYWNAFRIQKCIRKFLVYKRYLKFLLHMKCSRIITNLFKVYIFQLKFYRRIQYRQQAALLVHSVTIQHKWNRYIYYIFVV